MTATAAHPSTREHVRGPAPDHRWWVLVTLALAQLMVVLDATIVNIALPTAQQDLGFGNADRQWIVTAYSLAFGGLLLLGGKLSDLLGRRTTFVVGLVGFAAASAFGGFAQSFAWLVVARAIQGAFGALLAPAALSLLTITFQDPKERARAFGVFGAVAGSGGALGLLLGGVLTQFLSWRWCLFINVVFAAVAIAGALRFFGAQRRPDTRPKLDVIGTLLITAGLVAVVYGFSRANTDGWTDPWTLVTLPLGVVLVGLFVLRESRVRDPLLPLRVLAERNRGGSFLVILVTGASMFAVFLFLTYYLQDVLRWSPLQSGIGFLPMPVSIVLTSSFLSSRLLPRTGPKPLIVTGAALGLCGLLLMTRIQTEDHYVAVVLPALVVTGLGMGLIFSAATNTATYRIEPQDAGVGSALVNTGQQVGGSIGTALLTTIAAGATARASAAGASTALASIDGYRTAFFTSAGGFAVVLVIALTMLRWGRLDR